MAPWDETPSINLYALKKELLQMEKGKAVNKVVEEMLNCIRELFLALEDEEVFEEKTYEESHQEENTMSCDTFKTLMMLYSMTLKVKKCQRKPWI
jgi:hypothetical protein